MQIYKSIIWYNLTTCIHTAVLLRFTYKSNKYLMISVKKLKTICRDMFSALKHFMLFSKMCFNKIWNNSMILWTNVFLYMDKNIFFALMNIERKMYLSVRTSSKAIINVEWMQFWLFNKQFSESFNGVWRKWGIQCVCIW